MTHSSVSYRPSLKKKAAEAGGIGVDEAVAKAEQNVEAMRETLVAQIDLELEQLRHHLRALEAGDDTASEAAARCADALTGICSLSDLTPIGTAARSLFKLHGGLEGPLPASAVRVHLDALTLLRLTPGPQRPLAWTALAEGLAAISKATLERRLRRTDGSSIHPATPAGGAH